MMAEEEKNDELIVIDHSAENRDYLWKTKTTQLATFCKLIEAIQSILTDSHILINENGITLRDVDPLQNCCAEVILDRLEYHYVRETLIIAVDLQKLYQKLRHAKGELLILSVKADNRDILLIEVINSAKKKKITHRLALRKIFSTGLGIQVGNMSRVAQFKNTEFQSIIREVSSGCESKLLFIRSEAQNLYFGTIYDGLVSEIEVEPKKDEMVWTAYDKFEDPETFTNYYYIRYLERFCKNQLDKQVTVCLKSGQPLVLRYIIGNLGAVYFYLGITTEEDVIRLSTSSHLVSERRISSSSNNNNPGREAKEAKERHKRIQRKNMQMQQCSISTPPSSPPPPHILPEGESVVVPTEWNDDEEDDDDARSDFSI